MDVLNKRFQLVVVLVVITFSLQAGASDLRHLPFFKENFSDCKLSKENIFLKGDFYERLKNQLSSPPSSKIIKKINIDCPQKKSSSVYFLSDVVRTHYQTVLYHVQNGQMKNLEIVQFNEPSKYYPPKGWIKQFFKRPPSQVDALTGATLTRQSLIKLGKMMTLIANEAQKDVQL